MKGTHTHARHLLKIIITIFSTYALTPKTFNFRKKQEQRELNAELTTPWFRQRAHFGVR